MDLAKLGTKRDLQRIKLVLDLWNGTIDKIVDLPWKKTKPKWRRKRR